MTEKFWARVDADADCWMWMGALDQDGYGSYTHGGRKWRAHRFAFEDLRSSIPFGLQLDHLCRTRSCVNPDHLEPVTLAENLRRGIGGCRKDGRCKHGHLLDAENTLHHRRKTGAISKVCRTCWTGYFRKYRAQKRAALAA